IRPQDANGIYRREVSNSAAVEAAANAPRGAAGAGSRRTDSVTLSEGAREFARIMQTVQQAPDVRADRVADLRQQIASGEYVVDHTGLAALLADRGFAS